MNRLPKRRIAASYLPSRYHYWYSLSKLASDPLYEATRTIFAEDRAPLLDVGCGIGLLIQSLRASGLALQYRGIDIDAAKIGIAREAAARSGLSDVQFEVGDLTRGFPEHRGSVAVLDVLQYLEPRAQEEVLCGAARCIAPGGKLVIRGGLDDGSWRAAITRGADRFGHAIRWMNTSFKSQPKPSELTALLDRHGLESEFRPLWGRTPFNNWMVIARRSPPLPSSPLSL